MSVEDALFRVMAPVADALLEKKRAAGEPVDPSSIAELTLQQFALSVVLGERAVVLRERLLAHLKRG